MANSPESEGQEDDDGDGEDDDVLKQVNGETAVDLSVDGDDEHTTESSVDGGAADADGGQGSNAKTEFTFSESDDDDDDEDQAEEEDGDGLGGRLARARKQPDTYVAGHSDARALRRAAQESPPKRPRPAGRGGGE